MAEITIKEHVRHDWSGKTIHVKSYSRRVGRKGIRSPKRTEKGAGKELEQKIQDKKQDLLDEELPKNPYNVENMNESQSQKIESKQEKVQEQPKQEVPKSQTSHDEKVSRYVAEAQAKRAEIERKRLGLSRIQYSRYKLDPKTYGGLIKGKKGASPSPLLQTQSKTPTKLKKQTLAEKAESSIEAFVNKYGNKKYKRYF